MATIADRGATSPDPHGRLNRLSHTESALASGGSARSAVLSARLRSSQAHAA